MNYLAHALDVLDSPWSVAGTSLPDWLRVVDKRARLKPAHLRGLVLEEGSPAARLRDGVLKHHDDDHRFHTDERFEGITDEAVKALRALSPDPRFRASTLGHIVVEMLLDAALDEANPGSIDRYYRALGELHEDTLFELSRAWTGAPLPHLPTLLERFRRARFLFSYATDDGVVDALEGVCWRTGLPPPPDGSADVVARLRPVVRAEAARLWSGRAAVGG